MTLLPDMDTDASEPFAALRAQMIQFARLQLGSREADIEDVVQEALAGALRNAGSFAGEAAFRTWVFAILKNKIIDHIRRKQRRAEVAALTTDNGDEPADGVGLFDHRGKWQIDARPSDWGNPESDLLGKDFWRIFDACLNHLPPAQARVFMMREMMDMETPEICREIQVTVANLNVLLFRARLKLRDCLDRKWFARETKSPC